jgi:hypothetical protein
MVSLPAMCTFPVRFPAEKDDKRRTPDGSEGTYNAGYTLVTLPRTVTPYRDSVDGTRDHVTYQKLVMR